MLSCSSENMRRGMKRYKLPSYVPWAGTESDGVEFFEKNARRLFYTALFTLPFAGARWDLKSRPLRSLRLCGYLGDRDAVAFFVQTPSSHAYRKPFVGRSAAPD